MSNILIYFVQKLAHGNWFLQYGLLGDTKLSQIHFVTTIYNSMIPIQQTPQDGPGQIICTLMPL